MKPVRAFLWVLVASVLHAEEARSLIVEPRNLNFAYAVETFSYSVEAMGAIFDLHATYNSKESGYRGLFGRGWCTTPETRLERVADGNLRIIICGAGAVVPFESEAYRDELAHATAAAIVARVVAAKKVGESSLARFRADLVKDPALRLKFAKAYKLPIAPWNGPWKARGAGEIVRHDQGFAWTDRLGDVWAFSDAGTLQSLRWRGDERKYRIDLEWEGGLLMRGTLGGNKELFRMTYEGGRLRSVLHIGRHLDRLNVDDAHLLRSITWGEGADATTDRFDYDAEGRMTRLSRSSPATSHEYEIGYSGDLVKTLQRKGGCRETYQLSFERPQQAGDSAYTVRVSEACPLGGKESFWQGNLLERCYSESSEWGYDDRLRMIMERNVAEAGDPFSDAAARAQAEFEFSFDAAGRLTSAHGPGMRGFDQFVYAAGSGRIASVRSAELEVTLAGDILSAADRKSGKRATIDKAGNETGERILVQQARMLLADLRKVKERLKNPHIRQCTQ